ncbi:fluoride efflux transporter FluC [Phycisphaera mikurensis]|uniref:Fluoride-specific ion channel FluC n=1 Tax=Phycisphaera mikurensis (strain NBRC 102666 / KCTC 22515 / FYK2301M01) TaxID=1142394 RepID=I0IE85_PHYMF|nr:CrcB family protein [Phycisphaera mikurensis]MBB6441376.1 CrcB protein [Phycisphaera mikurensis]BAM03573.1 CrcB protein homolog [Phycisphaera mikurensis NBRC 102666]
MAGSSERWLTLGLIAVAGGAGALSRYGFTLALGRLHGAEATVRPLATLGVNATGCLAFGFFWAAAAGRGDAWSIGRVAVLTGFLGAFTTFSTFGFEVASLLRAGRPAAALAVVAAQNAIGIAMAWAGIWLGTRAI